MSYYAGPKGVMANTPKSYAAIGDGTSHPLSGFFGSLAAAQAAYPNAGITSLTQQLDRAAIQQLFHDWGAVVFEPGVYMVDVMLTFDHQYGMVHGNGAILKANANITACVEWGSGANGTSGAYAVTVTDLRCDGGQYVGGSGNLIANGTGATYGHWYHGCANGVFINTGADFCKAFGHFNDSSNDGGGLGVQDLVNYYSPNGTGNGTLEIQRMTVTAGASGTYTLTVTDRYGTTHTTGAINLNLPCGGNAGYNVAGLPHPGGTATSTTIEGMIGAALHFPAASPPTRGFGSQVAQPMIYASTNTTTSPASAVLSSAQPIFLIFQGDQLGPRPLVTVASQPSGGGTITIDRVNGQVGIRGGGWGSGGGVDSNGPKVFGPRFPGNNGDGMRIQNVGTRVYSPDCENNHGAGVRVEAGPGGTALQGVNIRHPWVEGNLDGTIFCQATDLTSLSYCVAEITLGGGNIGSFDGQDAEQVTVEITGLIVNYNSLGGASTSSATGPGAGSATIQRSG